MNKKKTIIINILLAAVLITVWLVFPKKAASIDLPSSKDIASIEVITTDGNKRGRHLQHSVPWLDLRAGR